MLQGRVVMDNRLFLPWVFLFIRTGVVSIGAHRLNRVRAVSQVVWACGLAGQSTAVL